MTNLGIMALLGGLESLPGVKLIRAHTPSRTAGPIVVAGEDDGWRSFMNSNLAVAWSPFGRQRELSIRRRRRLRGKAKEARRCAR